jgi:hypothetical protein
MSVIIWLLAGNNWHHLISCNFSLKGSKSKHEYGTYTNRADLQFSLFFICIKITKSVSIEKNKTFLFWLGEVQGSNVT